MTNLEKMRTERRARAKTYSQAEAARALGVSRRKYSELEKAPERLTSAQIRRLATYFEVEPEEVFFICR